MNQDPPPCDGPNHSTTELDPAAKRQAAADTWRRWWAALTAEQRRDFVASNLAEVRRQDEARDAMEAWQLQSWRASASSPYHRSMAQIEEINLAVRAAGAIGVCEGAEDPGPADHPGGVGFDLEGGRAIETLGEADDSADFAPISASPSLRWAVSLADDYLRESRADSGVVVDREKKDRRDRNESKLRRQSHFLATALERLGELGYRNSAWRIWRFWIHSGHVEEVVGFRNLCLFPLVAARNRRPLVNAIEWFLQGHPWCRFWTFTNGPRCRVGDLRKRLRRLASRLRELNAQPFMQRAGIQIILRAFELGTIEDKAAGEGGLLEHDEGGHWYHPHAHCLVYLSKGKLPPAEWKETLRRVWDWWGHHWNEGKLVEDPRECVKYVTKPGQMVQLAARDPKEFLALHHALLGLHLLQPMGLLRRELSHWRAAGLELYREPTADGFVWRVRRSINRSFFSRSRPSGITMLDGSIGTEAAVLRFLRMNHQGPPEPDTSLLDVCRVVAFGRPAAGPLYVKEPVVTVLGTRFDKQAVHLDPFVGRVFCETYDAFWEGVGQAAAAARASGITVHTGTTTVMPVLFDVPERGPPRSDPVWMMPAVAPPLQTAVRV